MKTKLYVKPTMKVVKLQHRSHILVGSTYDTTETGKTSLNAMGDDEDL